MHICRAIVVAGMLVALVTASNACRTSRFPTCETDEQCAEKDEGETKRFCVNVRCVECRGDNDCESGHVCNRRTNECDKL